MINKDLYLAHYGVKYKSGRYDYGSGARPYRHDEGPSRRDIKRIALSAAVIGINLIAMRKILVAKGIITGPSLIAKAAKSGVSLLGAIKSKVSLSTLHTFTKDLVKLTAAGGAIALATNKMLEIGKNPK